MTANQGSMTKRNIPDVAAHSDGSIWIVANNGEFLIVGGTSAATPLWAGFAALVNQQAAASGKPPIGFANPALYSIGKELGYRRSSTTSPPATTPTAAARTNFRPSPALTFAPAGALPPAAT